MGIHVEVKGGIGKINATGLNKNSTTYNNDAYNKSNTRLLQQFSTKLKQYQSRRENVNKLSTIPRQASNNKQTMCRRRQLTRDDKDAKKTYPYSPNTGKVK